MTTSILILVLLVAISAFFSSAETGMMAINRYRMQHWADSGNRSAQLVLRLLERPDRLLGIILIGNTFANILASAIATVVAVHYMGDPGIALATIILTFVVLIFAEVAPKTMAAHHADHYAKIVAWPLAGLLKVLYPLVFLVNGVANGLLKLAQFKKKKGNADTLSHEELRSVVDTSSKSLSNKHKEMLLSVFDLKKASVLDIMVPRIEMKGIDLTDDLESIIQQIKSSEHTRLPIFRNNIDNIEGVLHLRKCISLLTSTSVTKETLLAKAQAPYFVPEEATLSQQLLAFQQQRNRLAFVVDEYGKIQGLITLDDLLEEIVGEFTTDGTDTSNDIHPQEDGSHFLDGAITVRELNRELDMEFPTDGPKTLNGLILEQLESIPKAGAKLTLHGYPIEIIEIKDHRVSAVKIKT
jgi:Mg2+/Co2+ transporter CorB